MSHCNEASVTPPRSGAALTRMRLLFELFKLRIGLVIGFTAMTGLAVTPGPPLPGWRIVALALAVTMAAAAAGAFNQYFESDIDALMGRTRRRAFVTGRLKHGAPWLVMIIALGAGGVLLAAVAANAMAAAYTFLGAFTYGVVYTVWLKRRTWWNIVVGGLAGSFAVLAGAAAVAPGELGPLPLAFAVILFRWTRPHFWSLAIAFREDYEAAQVPMLPVVVGDARAARAGFTGSVMLAVASLVPVLFGMGWFYLVAALAGGAWLVLKSARLALSADRHAAMVNFHASLAQLTLLLTAAIVDAGLRN